MARVTVEDCIEEVEDRFELILLASHRARLIAGGQPLTIERDRDKNPVVALREIAEGTVKPADLREDLIESLQKQVEVDEADQHTAPMLPGPGASDAEPQFDRMSEDDLLRGLEEIVPPAETKDEEE